MTWLSQAAVAGRQGVQKWVRNATQVQEVGNEMVQHPVLCNTSAGPRHDIITTHIQVRMDLRIETNPLSPYLPI